MSGLLLLVLAQATPIGPAVAEPVLAEQRGGFRLPSGIDVALTVQTQTAIDGAVVLRTVFRADQGAPSLTIYAPKAGEVIRAGSSAVQPSQAATAPSVSYDRTRGIEVVPGTAGPIVSVTAGGTGSADAGVAGLAPIASGTVTDAGTVTGDANGVSLRGADFAITHLAGNAFGSVIANAGSDRAIDTRTTIAIDLGNVAPDVIGSAMFRMQDIAIDTAAMRAR